MNGTQPKVLLLPGLPSDDSRSMKRYATELYAALRVADPASGDVLVEQARQFDETGRESRLARIWSRWVTYPRAVAAQSASLFHILDQGYAHLAERLDPSRTIITCHDIIPLLSARGAIDARVPAHTTLLFKRKMRGLAACRRIIAISHATKATLTQHTSIDPAKVTVVHNGLTPAFRHRPGARKVVRHSARLDDRRPVILQVATAGRYKNTPALLHALSRLRTRVPDVVWARVGTPLHRDEVQLARRLGVQDALHYVGPVEMDEELAGWYNAADALLFPSSWEGFGWPPLEAMGCGTPVVAFAIPAVSEVMDSAGVLVTPGDTSALADGIERVLTDRQLAAELRTRGFSRAAQFTWNATARRMLAIYRELLGEPAVAHWR